jgi:curli biogenesis system outer membrane secretion channel CsgG
MAAIGEDAAMWLSTIHPALAISLVLLVWGSHVASAQNLKAGLEQLAEEIIKAVPEDKDLRVAVADFPDLLNITSNLGRYVANRLTTRLTQSQKFFVVERQRLEQVLQELRFSMSDLVDPEKAKKLGNMVGVQAIVVGTISDLGNQVDVDARVIDIETSRTVFSATTTISKDQTVAQLMEQGRTAPVAAAVPGSPVGLQPSPQPIESPQGGTTNIFQNNFLRVMRKSISRSEDKKRVNLVLQFENLTEEDLLISLKQKGANLLDDKGATFSLEVLNGIEDMHPNYRNNKESYTLFTPKSKSIIVMVFVSNQESQGSTFSFSAYCYRYIDKSADQFSVGIANMHIENR